MMFPMPTPEQTQRMFDVFEMVKPATRWKDPIRAFVPKSAATEQEIIDAVVFYCGGVPTVEVAVKGGVEGFAVTGAGYYVWIGA